MAKRMKLETLIIDRYESQAELAREVGVTRQAINNVVRGSGGSKILRYAIAQALDVEMDRIEWPGVRSAA